MALPGFFFSENPLNLAAVIYQPDTDVDGLMASFALGLRDQGCRVGGVVQRNRRGDGGVANQMELIDVTTGQTIPICQNLGSGSMACKLDQAGLADAAQVVRRAVGDDVELVIINKFGKSEAAGGGLRAEIADAVLAGIPLLTAVSGRQLPAWTAFTGGFGTTLLSDIGVIDDWWCDISRRAHRGRIMATAAACPVT